MNQRRDFIISLIKENILILDYKDGQDIYRLNSPCEIHLTEFVIEELNKAYLSHREIGGLLLATVNKENEKIYLSVEQVVFIQNASNKPNKSYVYYTSEEQIILSDVKNQRFLPLRFHTHPIQHNQPEYEILEYVIQINTSEEDQNTSYLTFDVELGTNKLLMPSSLILRSNNDITGQLLFVGFYGGGIAPLDFKSYRLKQIEKFASDTIGVVADWYVKDERNKVYFWIIILILAYITIRYFRTVIMTAIAIEKLHPVLINNANYVDNYEYCGHITSGKAVIEIP